MTPPKCCFVTRNEKGTEMSRELIRAIAEGQAHSQIELAGRLGVSEGLVEQMLEDLVRMGYLTPLKAGYAGQCAACPLAKTCIVGPPRRAWVLTEKGQKAAMGGQSKG